MARSEGAAEGSASWKVDLTGTGTVVDCALIKAEHTCFSSGAVQWTVAAGDMKPCPVPLGGNLECLNGTAALNC